MSEAYKNIINNLRKGIVDQCELNSLENGIEQYRKQNSEMQSHIDCLKAELEEAQLENQKLRENWKNLGLRCHDSARDLFEKDLCGCLHIVTADELTQKEDLPTEPIKVADMLIDKFTNASGDYVRATIKNGYPLDDVAFCDMRQKEIKLLRQIAEHLLVYCNNSEE